MAKIEKMLRKNREKQRVLAAGSRKSKEDILKMQEDIRRVEERKGVRLSRLDVDIEAFFKARKC